MWAERALRAFVRLPLPGPVLDIGAGDGDHACALRLAGRDVVTLGPDHRSDYLGIWPHTELAERSWGGIWASHVLEHSAEPGPFLAACRRALLPGGWLAVTVPPAKAELVGGHLTLWTPGLLLYHLVLAGFDCRQAMLASYDYNISVLVERTECAPLPPLAHDAGDLERLAGRFPLPIRQGMDGWLRDVNWAD